MVLVGVQAQNMDFGKWIDQLMGREEGGKEGASAGGTGGTREREQE